MNTAPSVSESRPARQCSSVDLPEPDGPMIAVKRPGSNVTLTPSSACDRGVADAVDLAGVDRAGGGDQSGGRRGDGRSAAHTSLSTPADARSHPCCGRIAGRPRGGHPSSRIPAEAARAHGYDRPPHGVSCVFAAGARRRAVLPQLRHAPGHVAGAGADGRGVHRRGAARRHGAVRRPRRLHRAGRAPRPRAGEAAGRRRVRPAGRRHRAPRRRGRQGARRRDRRAVRRADRPRGRRRSGGAGRARDAGDAQAVPRRAPRRRRAHADRRQHRRGAGGHGRRHRLHGDGRRGEHRGRACSSSPRPVRCWWATRPSSCASPRCGSVPTTTPSSAVARSRSRCGRRWPTTRRPSPGVGRATCRSSAAPPSSACSATSSTCRWRGGARSSRSPASRASASRASCTR